jgi:hypothetical protein
MANHDDDNTRTAVNALRELARWCKSALCLPRGFDALERAGFRVDRSARPTVLRLWGRALDVQRLIGWRGAAPPERPTRPEELGAAIAELRRWALRLCVECRRGGLSSVPAVPKRYLFGWREILAAVGLPNNDTNQQRLNRLNGVYEGPIVVKGQGSQPVVTEARLLRWWDGLERRFKEVDARRRDSAESVSEQYAHGRDGTVVPDIAGEVKKKRRRKAGG